MKTINLTYRPTSSVTGSAFTHGLICLALLLLVALPLITSPLLAQNIDRERLKEEIARTDEMLDRLQEQLHSNSDAKSTQLLQQAITLQRRAHDYYDEGRYLLAWNMTSKARDAIKRILGELVTVDGDRALVEQQLERTDEYLSRARQLLSGVDVPGLQMYVEEASRLQDRARDFFSVNNLRQALQFTRRAQELLKKASDIAGDRDRQQGQFENYMQQTRDQIESIRDFVMESQTESALKLFEVGSEQADRAQQLYDLGRFEEALRLLAQARSKLSQAERIIQTGDSPQGTLRAIELAQNRLDVLRERAEDARNQEALDLLEEAAEKLERARSLHSEGNYERALVVVRIVIELNQQAARILGG